MDHPVLLHQGTLWAVFIGVTAYDDPVWWPLPYCENDATALAVVFGDQARSGYPAIHSQLLAESASERFLKPTCGNIRAAIGRVVKAAGPEDTILIGFFGHGEERDGQSYLFPSDGWRASHEQAIALSWIQPAGEAVRGCGVSPAQWRRAHREGRLRGVFSASPGRVCLRVATGRQGGPLTCYSLTHSGPRRPTRSRQTSPYGCQRISTTGSTWIPTLARKSSWWSLP